VGLEEIRKNVLDESSGEPERLRERLREAQAATNDLWLERREPKTPTSSSGTSGPEAGSEIGGATDA
jgi:hypothetical protein